MRLISINCPSCNAKMQLDESSKIGYCEYCENTIMMIEDKILVVHTGKLSVDGCVSIDGIITKRATLGRAKLFLEDGEFERAFSYYEKALDLDPFCSAAYMGKLLSCAKKRSIGDFLENLLIPLSRFDDFVKARRFASVCEAGQLDYIEKIVLDTIDRVDALYRERIVKAEKKLSKTLSFLESLKKNSSMISAKRLLFTALKWLFIAASAAMLIGAAALLFSSETAGAIFFGILSAAAAALAHYFTGKVRGVERIVQELEEQKATAARERRILERRRKDYSEWLLWQQTADPWKQDGCPFNKEWFELYESTPDRDDGMIV